MLGGGGRQAGKAVGAGRGDGDNGLRGSALRDRMIGLPQRHGGQTRGDDVRNQRLLVNHQGQRAGPEGAREIFGGLRPFGGKTAAMATNPRERLEGWRAGGP